MKALLGIAIAVCILASVGARVASAANQPSKPMPAVTPELMEEGKLIYFRRCSFCHGLLGDGNGPASDFLDPRPRDFTLGTFKFRSTQSGELPLDADLFRTVSRGLPGTAMQAFDKDLIKNGLSEAQRWAVIAYVKTFAIEFEDEDLDPASPRARKSSRRPSAGSAMASSGVATARKPSTAKTIGDFPSVSATSPIRGRSRQASRWRTSICGSPPASAAHPCRPSSRR
jgi:mono/diheme cytochrome c family protein